MFSDIIRAFEISFFYDDTLMHIPMSIVTFHSGYPNRFAKNMEIKNKLNSMPFICYYDCLSSFSRLLLQYIFSASITLAGSIRIKLSITLCERDNPVDNCQIINKKHWIISIKLNQNLLVLLFVCSEHPFVWMILYFDSKFDNLTKKNYRGKKPKRRKI